MTPLERIATRIYWSNHKMEIFFKLAIWLGGTGVVIHELGWLWGVVFFFLWPFILRKF